MRINKAFVFVISNQFIHKISENIYDLALPLMILYYTKSSLLMGITYALGFLAEFVVGYFGGAIVDSFNRKKTLTTIAISQALLIAAIIILHNSDMLSIPLLLTLTFCIDLLLALYGITDISVIPEIVEKKDLPKANSYMQISLSIASSIGPSLAGALLTIIGIFNSLWVTFLGFLLLIFSLSLIKYTNQIAASDNDPKSIFQKSFEGLTYTWSNPLYKALLIWNVFINFGLTGSVLMIIYRLKEELSLSAFQIGIVYTLSAIGGIASGWILPLINKRFKSGLTLLTTSFLTALSLFGLFLATNWILVGILNSILMGSVALNSRLRFILYQTQVPIHYLGRVNSATRLISTILAPISVVAAGYFSKKLGATPVFLMGAIIILLTNMIALKSPLIHADWRDSDQNKGENTLKQINVIDQTQNQPFAAKILPVHNHCLVVTLNTDDASEGYYRIGGIGGGQEIGETIMECALREAREEACADVQLISAEQTLFIDHDANSIEPIAVSDEIKPFSFERLTNPDPFTPEEEGLPIGPYIYFASYMAEVDDVTDLYPGDDVQALLFLPLNYDVTTLHQKTVRDLKAEGLHLIHTDALNEDYKFYIPETESILTIIKLL